MKIVSTSDVESMGEYIAYHYGQDFFGSLMEAESLMERLGYVVVEKPNEYSKEDSDKAFKDFFNYY